MTVLTLVQKAFLSPNSSRVRHDVIMPSISTTAVGWSVEIPTKYWTITISSRKLKSFYSETGRLTFNEVPVSDDSSGYRS
jgi:hypothetical protein